MQSICKIALCKKIVLEEENTMEDDLRILRLTEHKALTGELTGYAHND